LLHRSHPAVKILLTLVFLVSLATVSRRAPLLLTADLALLVFGILAARLPLGRVLRMAAAVLPFAFLFALFAVLAGDTNRAGLLIVRSYLSALAVVLLVGTSRVSDLIAGLEFLHAPQFLLSVMQFLWRYLAVLSAEAATMRNASLSRAGSMRAIELRQAAGAAGILFARAWARAQAVHQAMLSRGFEGTLPRFRQPRFTASDVMLGVAGSAVVVAVRLAA
jgi:cobalt/nickel transport system permease protein